MTDSDLNFVAFSLTELKVIAVFRYEEKLQL